MLTGLLYAMKGEIESLLPEGAEPEKTVAGVPFYRIRENVVACCGGVGKVNAAMATQLFIDLYAPGRIVNVGVAGCFENVPIGRWCWRIGSCSTTWIRRASATRWGWCPR